MKGASLSHHIQSRWYGWIIENCHKWNNVGKTQVTRTHSVCCRAGLGRGVGLSSMASSERRLWDKTGKWFRSTDGLIRIFFSYLSFHKKHSCLAQPSPLLEVQRVIVLLDWDLEVMLNNESQRMSCLFIQLMC